MEDRFSEILCQEGLFVDQEFPSEKQSLIPNWDAPSGDIGDIEDWERYIWIRSNEIESLKDENGEQAIFAGQIEPNDIK